MHFQRSLALGAVLLGSACEVPVDTGASNPDCGVTSVAVQPQSASVLVGDSLQLSASVIMSNNRPPNSVNWTSTNSGLATVSSAGVVRGRAAGGLFIRASSGSKRDSAAVTVVDPSPPPVASVSVAPGAVTLTVGGTVSLVATLTDANGNTLAGRAITWASSNAGVATVSGTGRVRGVPAGWGTITATSEGQSGSATVAVTVSATAPGTVSDLAVAATTDSSVTLRFTEVDGGTGAPASYDIRYATGSTLSWGANTSSVTRGTCATPLSGTTVGGKRTCTVLGLVASTTYSFELVAFRGTLTLNAVFGALSNVATGTTTGGTTPPPPPPPCSGVAYYRTNFTDGTTGPLDVYAYNGGSCASSSDYADPGSAHSIKCTIPAGTSGAAALQAWFGNGGLANQPKDPSLDQDLFEEVRFVLAPGAASAIGGTSCNSSNPTSQFKVHKSVYGQVGSARNGWVMSDIGPCADGNIGLFSEPEMWTINGQEFPWAGTYPSLHEGTVYDVVYRYHRYTAQGCGTIAIWFNGTKVIDSPCWSYMGTTNASAEGLLFWDGAVYLQAGLTPLVVYNLFAQATNYPIGAGTASQ